MKSAPLPLSNLSSPMNPRPPDWWLPRAVVALHEQGYPGAHPYLSGLSTLPRHEAQMACDFALGVEAVIDRWESGLDPSPSHFDQGKERNPQTAWEFRRGFALPLFAAFNWYCVDMPGGRLFVTGGRDLRSMRRFTDALRGPRRLLTPGEAFEAAVSDGGIFWNIE